VCNALLLVRSVLSVLNMGRWTKPSGPISCDSLEQSANLPLGRQEAKPLAPASELRCRYVHKGSEKTAVFPVDASEDVSGALPSAPSGALKEFEDKLKAIDLCTNGVDKSEVAALLGRSEHWVKRWWRQQPQLVPKPKVRHAPLVNNAPLLSFRDLELRRAFVPGGAQLLEDLTTSLHWEPARRATRRAETAELIVRFDATGRTMVQPGRFVAEYSGGVTALDTILQQMLEVANIRDPGLRIFLNRYENGSATCPTHRHDFWTAMLSFGAERVALIEERPLLLRDGDLLVFGTQAHGCPEMPDVSGRRISVVVFFHPDADNLERRWGTLVKSSTNSGESRESEDIDDDKPSTVAALKFGASSHGKLVDRQLCGCPGISLGLVARRSLRISMPVTVFTIGCGLPQERLFIDILSRYHIDEVWDIRRFHSESGSFLGPENLRRVCGCHSMHYQHLPLGRSEAGGFLGHLASEEGQDALSRIVAAASEGRTIAIVGQMECWRECPRQAVAAALVSGQWGPVSVSHIGREGVEPHPVEHALPKWLSSSPYSEQVKIDAPLQLSDSPCPQQCTEMGQGPALSPHEGHLHEPRVTLNRFRRAGAGQTSSEVITHS